MRKADGRADKEYDRRTEGVGVEPAAAITVEISAERRKDEGHEAASKERENRSQQ